MNDYNVVIIGGGPAGLAAAVSAKLAGVTPLIIEREQRLGGILKQCIHDGFGLIQFHEKLTGPEYAERFMDEVMSQGIATMLQTFVLSIRSIPEGFKLQLVNSQGIRTIHAHSIVLTTGCRERTSRQVFIHGDRPAGIMNAGTAQYFINIQGCLPAKRCVILGSGDIGLIMARRLTLEGATVLGVYEAKQTPSGLTRNLQQCLYDFSIPLHLSTTVTKVFGDARVEAIEVASVDQEMNPIPGTEQKIDCDGVILSVGLIPENELAESLGIKIDPKTKGPIITPDFMTSVPGVYSAGNCLHVHDLVDYVSEGASIAGKNAAQFHNETIQTLPVQLSNHIQTLVPQLLYVQAEQKPVTFYFRVKQPMQNATLQVLVDQTVIITRRYTTLRPPEMERLIVTLPSLAKNSQVDFRLEGVIL